jgi:hypothetical protein
MQGRAKARSCLFVCAFFYWNRLMGNSFRPYERARHHQNIRMGFVGPIVGYAHTQRYCPIVRENPLVLLAASLILTQRTMSLSGFFRFLRFCKHLTEIENEAQQAATETST